MNFKNKTVLITGGTGFIGSQLIKSLLAQNVNVICYGRSINKIKQKFGDTVIATDTFDRIKTDYIIHAACPTESKIMEHQPVEVIDAVYMLTKESLECAKRNTARYLFLSSMEVYDNLSGFVDETQQGSFDLTNSRSSYPVAKQLAELLVNSYKNEFGINTCILRLSQIFGPGVSFDDNRFFIFALKKCLFNKDIVLNTTGDKWHNSCYIVDAVNLILKILLSNTNETLNITNEDYCMSINELCNKMISLTKTKSILKHDIAEHTVFRPDSKYKISNEKIRKMFPTYKMETFEYAILATFDYLKRLSISA